MHDVAGVLTSGCGVMTSPEPVTNASRPTVTPAKAWNPV